MRIEILDIERTMYGVYEGETQVAQAPIPFDWKLEASREHKPLEDVIAEHEGAEITSVVASAEVVASGVEIPAHYHREYLSELPGHDHPLPEHEHQHTHPRAIESEALLHRDIDTLDQFAHQVQESLRSHSHEPAPHEHPHAHTEMLEAQSRLQDSVTGLAFQVGEATRSHSHGEIQTGLAEVRALAESTRAEFASHGHTHQHPEFGRMLTLEIEERIADRAHSHELTAHSHKHDHGPELAALEARLGKQIGESAGAPAAHAHTDYEAGLRGSDAALADFRQRLAAHAHPHVHEDFLAEVVAVKQAFASHRHEEFSAALEQLTRRISVQEAHVHAEAAAHSHPDSSLLVGQIAELQNTVLAMSAVIERLNTRIGDLEARPTVELAPLNEAIGQLRAEFQTHIVEVSNRPVYFTAELSNFEQGGKRKFVVEEAPR